MDVSKLTLEFLDEEYDHALDTLERISALREAVAAQDHRRIKKLVERYNAAKAKESEQDGRSASSSRRPGEDHRR